MYTSSTVRTVHTAVEQLEAEAGQQLFERGLVLYREHTVPVPKGGDLCLCGLGSGVGVDVDVDVLSTRGWRCARGTRVPVVLLCPHPRVGASAGAAVGKVLGVDAQLFYGWCNMVLWGWCYGAIWAMWCYGSTLCPHQGAGAWGAVWISCCIGVGTLLRTEGAAVSGPMRGRRRVIQPPHRPCPFWRART